MGEDALMHSILLLYNIVGRGQLGTSTRRPAPLYRLLGPIGPMAKHIDGRLAPLDVQQQVDAIRYLAAETGARIAQCNGGSNCMHYRKKLTMGECCLCSWHIKHDQNGDILLKMGANATEKESGHRLWQLCILCWHKWHRQWDAEPCTGCECTAWLQVWQNRNPRRADEIAAHTAPVFAAVGAWAAATTTRPPLAHPAAPPVLAVRATTQPPLAQPAPPPGPPPTMVADMTTMKTKMAALEEKVAEARMMVGTVTSMGIKLMVMEDTVSEYTTTMEGTLATIAGKLAALEETVAEATATVDRAVTKIEARLADLESKAVTAIESDPVSSEAGWEAWGGTENSDGTQHAAP